MAYFLLTALRCALKYSVPIPPAGVQAGFTHNRKIGFMEFLLVRLVTVLFSRGFIGIGVAVIALLFLFVAFGKQGK